jgi:hypothetical protein
VGYERPKKPGSPSARARCISNSDSARSKTRSSVATGTIKLLVEEDESFGIRTWIIHGNCLSAPCLLSRMVIRCCFHNLNRLLHNLSHYLREIKLDGNYKTAHKLYRVNELLIKLTRTHNSTAKVDKRPSWFSIC